MELRPTLVGDALVRLRRAQGQPGTEVLTQLAAASRALDRAGFRVVASGLQRCQAARERGEQPPMNEGDLEKLSSLSPEVVRPSRAHAVGGAVPG